MKKLLDTNVILRYLLADHPSHSRKAKDFFHRLAKGEEEVIISPLTVMETVYFLEKFNHKKGEIAERILAIVNLTAIDKKEKEQYREIFDLYKNLNIDFVDAYHAVYCAKNNIKEIVSFDRDFDKVKMVRREEP